jgi:hypothetical protein
LFASPKANFAPDGMLKLVEIVLNGSALLNCMVEKTRLLVLKAVATATKTQVPSSTMSTATTTTIPTGAPSTSSSSAAQPHHHVITSGNHHHNEKPTAGASVLAAAANLSGFRSALNISSPGGLQKARSSALRLNSVLHGTKLPSSTNDDDDDHHHTNATTLGMRKVRSVRWNTPGQIPSLAPGSALAPSPSKKSRRVQTAAKLKSFKSFGRPHGGDFGSGPRNATFGEFGGNMMQNIWGRDGKMAHHPMPMQSLAFASQQQLGEAPVMAERNATFDLRQGGGSSSSVGGYNIHLSYSNNGSRGDHSNSSPTVSSMPRTATVLESLLLKNSMLKHSATLGKKP